MGNKEAIKEAKMGNKFNPDISSSEHVHNNKENNKTIFKRKTRRHAKSTYKSQGSNKTGSKSIKKNNMTKEQKHLFKTILKENMKKNKKRIAKNLAGIFLENNKPDKIQTKTFKKRSTNVSINFHPKINNIKATNKTQIKKSYTKTNKIKKIESNSNKDNNNNNINNSTKNNVNISKIKRFSSLAAIRPSNFSKQSKVSKQNEENKRKVIFNENKNKVKLRSKKKYTKSHQNSQEIIVESNDEKENEVEVKEVGNLKSDGSDEFDTNKMNFTSLFQLHKEINEIDASPNKKFSTPKGTLGQTHIEKTFEIEDKKCMIFKRKSFIEFVENNNKKDYDECLKFINSTQIISYLSEPEKSLLIQSLKIRKFSKDQCLLKAHEKCTVILFVKEGLLRCVDDDGKCIKTLTVGENFGEKEILTEDKIGFNLITISDCVCYSLSVRSFKKMVGNDFRNYLFYNFMKAAFYCSKLFQTMNIFYIEQIYKFFHIVNLIKDNVAFPIGHVKSSKFVIIVTGNLINSKNDKKIGGPLDILYEEELLSLSKDKINYALNPASEVLFLEGDTEEILHFLKCQSFEDVLNKNIILENLSKIVLFKTFSQLKLCKLMDLIQIENYKAGDKIIKEGTQGEKFYIVKTGQVEIYQKNIYLRTLNQMEYFGERALLTNEVRSATVIAKNDVQLYSLDKESFNVNLSDMMLNYLHISLYLHDETVSLDDLVFIKEVGKGNYGSVSLVMNRRTKFPYAIKAINKYHIITEKLNENIELEKKILLKIDHPFIVKLVKSLKDENNIFFLLEYIKGKELFDVIRDIGYLNKEQTNFYIASMMIAIQYLHERKIIYRDIKPENIIIKKNGYLKLIDFGTAKEIEDRTKTIIGTPHYMAPEIIMGGGYSFQVDFWSISICMYEFMCGQVPFGEKDDDPMEIYFAIINNHISFPKNNFTLDKEFKHLMKKMLDKNPSNRLCSFQSIKNTSWFKDFNWDELANLNLKAPYLPLIVYSSFDFDEQCKPLFDYEEKKFQNYVDYIKEHGSVEVENKQEISAEKLSDYNIWYDKF